MVASAASYVVSPDGAWSNRGRSVSPPSPLSASYLIALAARIVREVSGLMRRARKRQAGWPRCRWTPKSVSSLPPTERHSANELTATVTTLVSRYHDATTPGGRPHRLVVVAHRYRPQAFQVNPSDCESRSHDASEEVDATGRRLFRLKSKCPARQRKSGRPSPQVRESHPGSCQPRYGKRNGIPGEEVRSNLAWNEHGFGRAGDGVGASTPLCGSTTETSVHPATRRSRRRGPSKLALAGPVSSALFTAGSRAATNGTTSSRVTEPGWEAFFRVLRLYLANFRGFAGSSVPFMARRSLPGSDAWHSLLVRSDSLR